MLKMWVLFPGSGRCLGGGNDNLVQYSCLGDPMDRGAWQLQSMGSKRVGHKLASVYCHSSHSFPSITLHLGAIIDLEGLETCSCLNLFYTFSFRLPEWFSHACCCKDAIYVQEKEYQHWEALLLWWAQWGAQTLTAASLVLYLQYLMIKDCSRGGPSGKRVQVLSWIWLVQVWEELSGGQEGHGLPYPTGVLGGDVPLLVLRGSLSPISPFEQWQRTVWNLR